MLFNPITQNNTYLKRYAILWLCIIALHAYAVWFLYSLTPFQAILDATVFNVFFAFLGLSLWYVVRYSKDDSASFSALILSHFTGALVVIGFWLITGNFLLNLIISDPVYDQFLSDALPWRVVSGVFYYAVFVLVYYTMVYSFTLQEKIREQERLNTLMKEVELDALKAQINPHFLFNALNSISSLIYTNQNNAQKMLIELSDFLRYSVALKAKLIPLQKELENIERYLAIEKIRFSNKMSCEFEVPEICNDLLVPSMILQPLFENAIKHGVQQSTEQIAIVFQAELNDGVLALNISNNFDSDSKNNKGEGIGLKNISERLFLEYQRNNLLRINKGENLFEVEIKIPIS